MLSKDRAYHKIVCVVLVISQSKDQAAALVTDEHASRTKVFFLSKNKRSTLNFPKLKQSIFKSEVFISIFLYFISISFIYLFVCDLLTYKSTLSHFDKSTDNQNPGSGIAILLIKDNIS